ncbi:MAG: CoA-transferase subunit beta [Candidatus Thorarchaeota archaeon]
MKREYTETEMMAIACARRIQNNQIVFCGTGLPLLAAATAKKTHAPDCTIFFETGAMDPTLMEIPLTVADPRVMHMASHLGSLADAFSYMQNQLTGGNVLGILSGAQIDKHGNLNSTMIGDYDGVKTRFPGSGGACDVASFVDSTFIFMRHERRRFVKELDYLTSPGWLSGGSSRIEAGIPRGGPKTVITTLGILSFDVKTKEMFLSNYYDVSSPQEIQDNTQFELDLSLADQEPPPSSNELDILRNDVDPMRLIL